MDYTKYIKNALYSRRIWVTNKYNFKSDKYTYISNVTFSLSTKTNGVIKVDTITLWCAKLDKYKIISDGYGNPYWLDWDYYSDSEEECAKETYKMIKANIKRIAKENKRSRYKTRDVNWQSWLDNYELIKHK